MNARSADVGLRVASVQGARVESAAGHRLVRLIDSLVRPSLESNQAMLAEWKSLVRFRLCGAGAVTQPVGGGGEVRVGDGVPVERAS